jgi:VWA domain-containing protein
MVNRIETLGPAERIIQLLLNASDHMVHNRPGMIEADASSPLGVKWHPVTHRAEGEKSIVFKLTKVRKRKSEMRVGELCADGGIVANGQKVATYRPAGIFPEMAVWMYRPVAAIYQLDNEFCARWASFAYGEKHRDLKVVLAAFMLVQGRRGDPVVDDGQVAFYDDDYRDVGEAMMLLYEKGSESLNPKLLLRIRDVLCIPEIAALNRELGFGRSARRPFVGRWNKATEKWLEHRENNPKLLEGLVKAGYRQTVMQLARHVGYKPQTPYFFEVLRWKQAQAKDGRRSIAIGIDVAPAETWAELTEQQICERIVADKPGFKRIVGMVPREIGLTRAITAAAIEAGCLSDKDLVILTPTLEELGLMQVQEIRTRWEIAVKHAEDMRAANIAARVKNEATRAELEQAADEAVKKAVEAVAKNIRVYFMVDISSSMTGAIDHAKDYIEKFLHSFPVEQVHVSVFNTQGREVVIKHASAAGVRQAFRGIHAGGGTDYGAGVRALQTYRPKDDEDVLFIFVGDEEAGSFEAAVTASGLGPMAFGFVRLRNSACRAVQDTAAALGIPCFMINEETFADVYAIPRTVRALVAATPVGKSNARVNLIAQILDTALLKKPVWAA